MDFALHGDSAYGENATKLSFEDAASQGLTSTTFDLNQNIEFI